MLAVDRLALHLLALSSLVITTPAWALEMSCHIHAPAQNGGSANRVVSGRYESEEVCELLRQRRFGTGGRCHCVYGFTSPVFPGKQSNAPSIPGESGERTMQ